MITQDTLTGPIEGRGADMMRQVQDDRSESEDWPVWVLSKGRREEKSLLGLKRIPVC